MGMARPAMRIEVTTKDRKELRELLSGGRLRGRAAGRLLGRAAERLQGRAAIRSNLLGALGFVRMKVRPCVGWPGSTCFDSRRRENRTANASSRR